MAASLAVAAALVGCSGGSSGDHEATVNAAMEAARQRDFPDGRITVAAFTLTHHDASRGDAARSDGYAVEAGVIAHGLAAELACDGDAHRPDDYVSTRLFPLPPSLPTFPVERPRFSLDEVVSALERRAIARPTEIDLVPIDHRATYECVVTLPDDAQALVDIDATTAHLTLAPLAAAQ